MSHRKKMVQGHFFVFFSLRTPFLTGSSWQGQSSPSGASHLWRAAIHRVRFSEENGWHFFWNHPLPSLKLTWHLKMVVSNRNLLFQRSIFRCYVSFQGGFSLDLPGRLTWNRTIEVWKIIFLSKMVICRFHVNLQCVTITHICAEWDWKIFSYMNTIKNISSIYEGKYFIHGAYGISWVS